MTGVILPASTISASAARSLPLGVVISGLSCWCIKGEDLAALAEMIAAGKITPVIDRTYPFAEIPAALGYAARGHVRGKVVITLAKKETTDELADC